jgi:hypothetical protein
MKLTLKHSAAQAILICAVSALSLQSDAATCPFDSGASDALNDGVVLTRYALGIAGAPLVTSTRYASLDPLQVKNNIECVGCALDMNGDGAIDTVDTTIIARHLSGFTGSALTQGLSLGSAPAATRPDTASITSFLANGCAVGGAINAFTNGGNAFGGPAFLGTTDNQSLFISSGGNTAIFGLASGGGWMVTKASAGSAQNIIAGSAANSINTANAGSTIGGGGHTTNDCLAPYDGFPNDQPCANSIDASTATIAGGTANVILSGANQATIGGGYANNISTGSERTTIAGGAANLAYGPSSTISGGSENYTGGAHSVVPGGFKNSAFGESSFAAGRRAVAGHRTFVWNSYATSNNLQDRTDSFRVQAANGVDFNYGPNREHFVAFNLDTAGAIITSSVGARLTTGGVWQDNSDRSLKRDFKAVNPKAILEKLLRLPVSKWSYNAEQRDVRHIGPMAQDFYRLFGVGYDDKTMNSVDRGGVAFAAIQGLNQKLTEQVKAKDREIAALKARLDAIERKLLGAR